jgi:hypothetical protein
MNEKEQQIWSAAVLVHVTKIQIHCIYVIIPLQLASIQLPSHCYFLHCTGAPC